MVSNASGYLGLLSGSAGVATVTGTGSQWNNSNSLYIGANDLQSAGGSGTLNINDSGLTTVVGTTKLWSTGTLKLNGGSLTTGSLDNSQLGTLDFYDGTLTVNGAGGVFNPGTGSFTIDGSAADHTPRLVIAGTAEAALSGDLKVGGNQRGTLTVESGGVVSNTNGSIGLQPGSSGEALVTGLDSQWTNSGGWAVGDEGGDGTLNVAEGGVVSNSDGYLSYESGSTGVVTVTGAGSQWNNSNNLIVGNRGAGTLNVEAGGLVSNTFGYIGRHSGSTGVATVTGTDSKWTSTSNTFVGYEGNGELTISNGGTASDVWSSIGRESGSSGVVVVRDAGSSWTHSEGVMVGFSGRGELTASSGASVSNPLAWIAELAGSTGVATVTGSGSEWNNSNSLYIGGSDSSSGGSGTLKLTDSGLTTVAGTTKLWSTGTINLCLLYTSPSPRD